MASSVRPALATSAGVRRCSRRTSIVVLMLAAVPLSAVPLRAADAWVAVDSPHVTVISNAGDRKAARIARQFEVMRVAITSLFRSADAPLQRPFVVIAAKDESTMKATAPAYWRGDSHPNTVVAGAPDKQFVGWRADVEPSGREPINPHLPAFRVFTYATLDAAYGPRVPLALREGLSWVFGNAAIGDTELQLGRVNGPLRATFLREPRLPLAELLSITAASPYASDPSTRGRFNAQSWALVEFLMLGSGSDGPKRLGQVVALITAGTAADVAMRQVYGPLDKVENDEATYINAGPSQMLRVSADTKTVTDPYPMRRLDDVGADSVRAAFQLASGSPAEAAKLLAAAQTRNDKAASVYEVEGLAADRERNTDAAQRAYKRAADLGSTNFYVYVRLASAAMTTGAPDAERLLGKAIELNQSYAPALAMLATVLFAQNRPANALGLARRAVELEPDSFGHHLLYARILQRNDQAEQAQAIGREALALARTEQERQAARLFLNGSAPAAAGPVRLKVTDTAGVSTTISAPSIGYAGTTSSAVVAERAGIRIYQGQGQVVVNWLRVDSIAFSTIDSTTSPPRIKGRLTLAGGQPSDREFVVPPGRLTGQADVGSFSIALADIAAISVVKSAQ